MSQWERGLATPPGVRSGRCRLPVRRMRRGGSAGPAVGAEGGAEPLGAGSGPGPVSPPGDRGNRAQPRGAAQGPTEPPCSYPRPLPQPSGPRLAPKREACARLRQPQACPLQWHSGNTVGNTGGWGRLLGQGLESGSGFGIRVRSSI